MSIKVIQGDITKMEVDVIVNAANTGLRGGGGVDGAIHKAGGPQIMEECQKIGGCPTGQAVITTSGNLPQKKVIHAVGPVWHGGKNGEEELLYSAYKNSLELAAKHNFKSIAFPNISTGVYGYPKGSAADVALKATRDFLKKHPEMEVTFVCFDGENYEIYQRQINNQPQQ